MLEYQLGELKFLGTVLLQKEAENFVVCTYFSQEELATLNCGSPEKEKKK